MSSKECLICYVDSETKRSELANYICKCDYFIHVECYDKWKQTGTARLCIICDVEEIIVNNTHILDPRVYMHRQMQEEYDHRMRMTRCRRFYREVCIWIYIIVFIIVYIIKNYL